MLHGHFQGYRGSNLPTDPVIISLASSPSSSVMLGENIILTCSVVLPDGVTGTPDYQWMGPAGGVIDTATHSSNDQSVSSVLTLSEIAPSQAGLYMHLYCHSGKWCIKCHFYHCYCSK